MNPRNRVSQVTLSLRNVGFMRMVLKSLAGFLMIVLTTSSVFAQDLPAFPGAEGFGKYTTGGRGGKVICVTNLEDNTLPGSFRYAVSQPGARIVIFKVSGTIQLKSNLNISSGNLTVAGQTAPGDGICLRDYTVEVKADNVIIRYMRFRLGDVAMQQNDCIWGRDQSNIILDHCTMNWSTDECASFYDNKNFTMQWCLVGESLRNSVHDKGSHGYGGIWGGQKASFHHNLIVCNDNRNPRFCGSRYTNRPDLEMVDFRNNVVYNWGANSAYAAEGGSYNLVNNYYKAGPATPSSKKSRIIQPYPDVGANTQPAGIYGKFYVNGNVTTGSASVTADNWLGVDAASQFSTYGITKNELKSAAEFPVAPITTHTAEIAYQKVLAFAGACLVRDTVEKRIVHDVAAGTATVMDGGNGSTNGIIDTQTAVGGWPVLKSLPAPEDTDNDGMPDTWEVANGLNRNDPSDARLSTVDGKYPNLEVYLNSLVSSITENELKDALYSAVGALPKANGQMKVLMNPKTGILQVSSGDVIRSVKIFSINGCLLGTGQVSNRNAEIAGNQLPKGIYVVSVLQSNSAVYSLKFVKN